MAPRKRRIVTAPPRRPKRSTRPQSTSRSSPVRIAVGLIALLTLAMLLYVARSFVEPPPPPDLGARARPHAPSPQTATTASKTADAEAIESTPTQSPAYDAEAIDSTPSTDGTILHARAPGYRVPGGPARLAIVIDDLGRSLDEVDVLSSIGVALTYAVLPFETRTEAVVARLRSLGVEILCHLPMEPSNGLDPGPGALRASMNATELARATDQALAAVPGAVGVNNHMGSGLSKVRPAMAAVLGVVADRGLYFLDSRTTADTVGYTIAREMGLPTGERQVFLDTDRDPEAIRFQFQRLLDLARSRGGAIGIGHPYPETLALLRAELPSLREQGFEIVPASELLDHPR